VHGPSPSSGILRLARCLAPVLALTVASLLASAADPPRPSRAEAAETDESEALRAIQEGRFVRARELAERMLARNPRSAVGELVLGRALHDGEGNTPLALAHFRRALALTESPGGVSRPGMERWHREALYHLMWAASDLGRFEQTLGYAARVRALYEPALHGLDVWPLMKLGREEEARTAAARAMATGDPLEEIIGRNGLCALDGYPACVAVLEAVRRFDFPAGLALRNAAVAAQDAGRFDEAERLLLESTRVPDEEANPWRDLAALYATQGRMGEAVAAARAMALAVRAAPRRVQQYTRAQALFTSSQVLLLTGHPDRALAAVGHALDEPDRAAHWSGSEEATIAECALLERAIRLTLAELLDERAAVCGWAATFTARAAAAGQRLRGWYAGRRVAPVLLAGGLEATNESTAAGPQLAAPPWLQLDAVALLGPAAVRPLVDRWLEEPFDPPAGQPPELRAAYLAALRTEAICLAGDDAECLADGAATRASLPSAEVLLRVRLAARMASAAWRLGRIDEAATLFEEVLERDPGALRRLGLALPARLRPGGDPVPLRAAELSLGSGRFQDDPAAPFTVGEAGGRLCLLARGEAVLACATPADAASVEGCGDGPASKLAAAFLDAAFAPRLEMSQQDLTTLDGTTVAERRVDPRALELLAPAPER
jgi:tetratricopeptide (TPR) repeat protein